ncbi:MAG: type II secretion system protein N [Pseudomonadota bacterium]
MKRLPILFTFLAVLALSASSAYWFLQFSQGKQRPLAATSAQVATPDPVIEGAATLFGGQTTVVASNYQLKGVVAANRASEGVAIIAADGKPPVAVKVGHEVAPGVSVKEVQRNFVTLSEGGVLKRIDLASDAKAGASGVNLAPPAPPQMQQPMQQPLPQMQQMPQPVPPPPSPSNMGLSPTTAVPPTQ